MTAREILISGRAYPLGRQIGKGGEGEVYAVDGRADIAAKIYKPNLRSDREPKVRAMVEHQLASSTKLVAFPSEIATDKRGAFLGFLMRLVTGYRPLHELYSPKSRRKHFPSADYRFLVRAALNVTNAVGKVHQTGCVIGDLNHSGILVAQDATVALIDADSFQFSLSGRHFPCVVGVPDFTPPELHGKTLSKVVRTQAHDNFGLAVAIFQLLAMGKHPYAGRYAHGDLSLADSIAQNRFAFSLVREAQVQTTPPPGSIGLKEIPPQIAAAFESAFGLVPAQRPGAAAWAALLRELEQSLSRCSQVKTHFYPSAARSCVWCKLTTQTGVDMFPDLGTTKVHTPSAASFDWQKIIRRLNAINIPPASAILPATGSRAIGPSSEVEGYRRAGKVQKFWSIASFVAAAVVILASIGAEKGFLLWFAAGLAYFGWSKRSEKQSSSLFEHSYQKAHADLKRSQLDHLRRIGYVELLELIGDLRAWIDQHQELDRRLATDLQRLTINRRQRHLDAYLDRFRIRDASITGIGPSKAAVLASFGVETAADVDASKILSIPGFGDQLTKNLLDWRLQKERSFAYNPVPNATDLQEELRVRSVYDQSRATLENSILSALSNVEMSASGLSGRAAKIDHSLEAAYTALDQAKFDLLHLSLPIPNTSPLSVTVRKPRPMTLPPGQVAGQTATAPPPPPQRAATRVTTPPAPPPVSAGPPSCPQCGSHMVRRVARRGPRSGNPFWGCSRFPRCRGTRN